MAVTPLTAHLVDVAAASPEESAHELIGNALAGAGVPIMSRALVEADDAALDQALAAGHALTVIVVGAGESVGGALRRALARVTGSRLVLNERMLAALEEEARRRDRPLARRRERLALLPQGAVVWVEPEAEPAWPEAEPAWMVETPTRVFVVLGRGRGERAIVERHLIPFVMQRFAGSGTIAVRTFKTVGVAVGELEERLASWLGNAERRPESHSRDVSVTVLPAEGDAWVRVRARGATPAEASAALAAVEREIATALGPDCYGRDTESLEEVVGRSLIERKLTVSVAESCTGGLLGHRLTSVPGSSAYFERGVLVYSNRAKQEMLGVPEEVLRTHGAVSAPCAEAMARGIVAASGSPCGVAITGIAGPDGGTPTKPVGTVFIGLVAPGLTTSRRFLFPGDRASVKWQSTQMALDMLRRGLQSG